MNKSELIKWVAAIQEKADRVSERADQIRDDIYNNHEALKYLNEIISDIGYDLYCIKEELEDMDDQTTKEG